ncbi:right-handed parallel beta-helix repeat-containing protein [Patescibacteria group bacterium]|nr:right-handed parallel beta-helix repeat-containing protein [Patescibacteria group bacterium]
MHNPDSPKFIFLSMILIVFSALAMQILLPKEKSIEIRSKAAAPGTKTVCAQAAAGCDYAGPAGLQQAVDAAQNGDTIIIGKGTYSGPQETPVAVGWGTSGCFLDLRGKSLTLKGEGSPFGEFVGSVLYGEGHSKPNDYVHRAGICSTGGTVTIDSLHIKEFQGRGLILKNTNLILKNSLVDGNDQGGLILTKGSSILAVNDFWINNIGVTTDNAVKVMVYNNTFSGSKAINADCNQNIPPMDFVNNIVVDDELTIGAGWIYGNCPDTVTQFKNQHIAYDLLWKNNHPCYDNHEYCTDFTGKIAADPLLDVAANDQSGWRGWGGNYSLKTGSPAIGAGDPSIPGGKDLGTYGGPCADGSSSTCTSFITQMSSQLNSQPPAPTSSPNNNNQSPDNNNNSTWNPTPWVGDNTNPPNGPAPTSIYTNPAEPTNPPAVGFNPPITYYLPPTIPAAQNGGNNSQSPSSGADTGSKQPSANQPTTLPSPIPTTVPIIDIKKTVDSAKSTVNTFITNLLHLAQTILP